jgi:membrane protein required for colicin V production
VLVVLLLLIAGFTPFPQDPWWQESPMIRSLLPLADWAAGWLPDSMAEYFDLHPDPVEQQARA